MNQPLGKRNPGLTNKDSDKDPIAEVLDNNSLSMKKARSDRRRTCLAKTEVCSDAPQSELVNGVVNFNIKLPSLLEG